MEAREPVELLSERPKPPLHLVYIEPKRLPTAWEHIAPLLEKACAESQGEFSLHTILANLEHWPIIAIVDMDGVRAVGVTCVTGREGRPPRLDILLASGEDAKVWPQVDDQLDVFARELGCSAVCIPRGRKGWAKTLPHWRLKGTFVMLERDV